MLRGFSPAARADDAPHSPGRAGAQTEGCAADVPVEAAGRWRCLASSLARAPTRGKFCFGDAPTMADCALVPQLFSAARFNVDTQPYPTLRSIYEACEALPEFAAAHPARQPDSE